MLKWRTKHIDKCIYKVYINKEMEMSELEARLQKWGNSDGIRIPKTFLKTLNLKTNDRVDMKCENDKIIISKSREMLLEERFQKYNGKNLAKDFTWDDARGNELW